MHLIYGNMFDPSTHRYQDGKSVAEQITGIAITTNGFTKKDGSCVMGRGCALAASSRWPKLPIILGNLIKLHGNHVLYLGTFEDKHLISFPVKPSITICNDTKENIVSHMKKRFKPGDRVPGWAAVASIDIIKRSAYELRDYANSNQIARFLIPRPGCGAGELDWNDIKPILDKILDNRFYCITFGNKDK